LVYKSPSSLANKWDRLIKEREELGVKAGPVTWPKAGNWLEKQVGVNVVMTLSRV
jgi:hypothetical protein